MSKIEFFFCKLPGYSTIESNSFSLRKHFLSSYYIVFDLFFDKTIVEQIYKMLDSESVQSFQVPIISLQLDKVTYQIDG